GFRQYIHRRDPFRRVEVSLGLSVLPDERLAALVGRALDADLTVQFGLEQQEVLEPSMVLGDRSGEVKEIEVPSGRYVAIGNPRVEGFRLDADNQPLLWMTRRGEKAFSIDRLDRSHPIMRR